MHDVPLGIQCGGGGYLIILLLLPQVNCFIT